MDKTEMDKITWQHWIYRFMGWEMGENKTKHKEQKRGCPVIPSPENASASKGNKEARRLWVQGPEHTEGEITISDPLR